MPRTKIKNATSQKIATNAAVEGTFRRGIFLFPVLTDLCGVIGKDINLRPLVSVKHKSSAAFGCENDPVSGRPIVVAAVPLDIQEGAVIHLDDVTGRRGADDGASIPAVLRLCAGRAEGKQAGER